MLAIGAMVLPPIGCSKKTTETVSSRLSSGSGHASVTYQPNVRLMEREEGEKALIGVSSNNAALLFDSSNATARALKAGDVLVIKGLIARTVLASELTPDGVVVITQQATVPEVIRDGEITVQAPVRFGAPVGDVAESSPSTVAPKWPPLWAGTVYAQSPTNEMAKKAEQQGTRDAYGNIFKGVFKDLVEGWKVTFSSKPEPGKIHLDLTLTRETDGFEALITGKGYISDFDFNGDIGVQQGVLQKVETGFKNLNGLMNFNWQVAKQSGGIMAEESRVKLPGTVEIPLWKYVDGLPLYLEISSAILIHPAITGGSEVTKGAFHITYDGYQHFTLKQGSINSDGNVNGDIQLEGQSNISPTAPLGMLVSFAAPRIELTLGLEKIIKTPNIQKAADYVDQLADAVAKKLLGPDGYEAYKNGPMGRFSLGKTLKNMLSTSGAATLQLIGTSATSYTGMSAIAPCSRADLNFVVLVGVSAVAWGEKVGNVSKEVYRKERSKVDPPGMALCENIGKK